MSLVTVFLIYAYINESNACKSVWKRHWPSLEMFKIDYLYIGKELLACIFSTMLPSTEKNLVVYNQNFYSPEALHYLSPNDCACAVLHSKASLEMRAVPTWVDKVHDRDKQEQW